MNDLVSDDEFLYRRIPSDPLYYKVEDSGKLILSANAFSDRKKQPSVDRAKLCNYDPAYTQRDHQAGVISLIAHEVRAIGDIQSHTTNPPITHRIDVVPVPLSDNPAHAEIQPDPAIASDNVFKHLRTSLAILANKRGWLIYPHEYRNHFST